MQSYLTEAISEDPSVQKPAKETATPTKRSPSHRDNAYQIISALFSELKEFVKNLDLTEPKIKVQISGNEFFQTCKRSVEGVKSISNDHKTEIIDEVERIEKALWRIANHAQALRVNRTKRHEAFTELEQLIRESKLTRIAKTFREDEIPHLVIKRASEQTSATEVHTPFESGKVA